MEMDEQKKKKGYKIFKQSYAPPTLPHPWNWEAKFL